MQWKICGKRVGKGREYLGEIASKTREICHLSVFKQSANFYGARFLFIRHLQKGLELELGLVLGLSLLCAIAMLHFKLFFLHIYIYTFIRTYVCQHL